MLVLGVFVQGASNKFLEYNILPASCQYNRMYFLMSPNHYTDPTKLCKSCIESESRISKIFGECRPLPEGAKMNEV